MGLYDGIKDVANIIQKADNIELYKKLIDLCAQALEMQEELAMLKLENRELKEQKSIADKIERHEEPYITLKNDVPHILYCSHCWDSNRKLIQGKCNSSGQMYCPECKERFIYDKDKHASRKHGISNLKVYGM